MTDDDLKSLLLTHATEIRRQFDVVVERMDNQFALVAEAITQVDQKLDRVAGELGETIERTAADTQAMVKFSHAELDHRIRTLEQTVADVVSRVERLERSTQ